MNYYSHTCKCGCNGQIEVKGYHKWWGFPLYINGHNGKKENKKCLYKKCNNLVTKLCNKFCSHKCYSLNLKGKSAWNKNGFWSIEHKQKLSKIHTGKKLTKEHKNNIGKALEGEKSHFYGIHNFGGLSPNWQGGKSFEPYSPEFNKEKKSQILKRDNYICQRPNCMNIENLHVHHIDYNKKNNLDGNLIILCISCHMNTNGKKNRPYWTNYYQEILNVYL